ncbi:unnamed protein product [Diamesa tonsa]
MENSIQQFYNGKSVFITGASGFMGKVLLEKLLYSCPGLKKIYILMRAKRGKSGRQRVEEFSSLPLFNRLNQEMPEVLKKIVPVFGELSQPELGLSVEDLKQVLSETNIVFHMAATVNFEASLKRAVELNILGTQKVIDMCKKMPKLVSVLHLSTAFSCCDQEMLEEKVYKWHHDPVELLKMAETMNEAEMEVIKADMLGVHPNTYTYTKRLAELLVEKEHGNLPICIARPSIVTPAYSDPLPGWVDNLNGPIGILVSSAKGLLRSMIVDGDLTAEVIPVDLAINGLISIAWDVYKNDDKKKDILVYNITCSEKWRMNWRHLIMSTKDIVLEYPFENGVWYPGGGITLNPLYNYTSVFFTQTIPAYILDTILLLLGKKRFVVQKQKKISLGVKMLHYFTLKNWDFRSNRFQRIRESMTQDENTMFNMNTEIIDDHEYLTSIILGGRQYCMKEPLSSLPKARKHLQILKFVDYAAKIFWVLFLFWMLMKISQMIFFLINCAAIMENSIQQFYNGKSVFITGASGFMGKVLLEKLLYSCPGLKKIYILMRAKRGKSGEQRVEEFSSLPLFNRLNQEMPEVLKKIVPVFGELSQPELGLSVEDLKQVLSETNIVFHMAATVNFEASLKRAVELNILGTQKVIDMCKKMPKLVSVLHLSTAFSCCDQEMLEEKVYKWHHDPVELLKMAETMNEAEMEVIKADMLGVHPNTYTYTKRLAELLVEKEHGNLPICIARPSIVTPAYCDPLPGWVDNLNGPIGILVAAAKGLLKIMMVNGDLTAEIIPVDLAINGLISIAWDVYKNDDKKKDILVYNITCSEKWRMNWRHLMIHTIDIVREYPFENGVWYPGGGITLNPFYHYTLVFFTQTIPAYILDAILLLLGKKRFVVQTQKKISLGLKMLHYFTLKKWDFRSNRFQRIRDSMTQDENTMFNMNTEIINDQDYLKSIVLGGRQYCMKEPLSSLPKARTHLKM